MIIGSNNGTFGMGMARGAVFPPDPGYFYSGYPLPQIIEHPTGVMDKPYKNRFGSDTVYELTPGGVTTESSWGFTQKAFGSLRRSRTKKTKRCKALKKNNGKQCKHKTSTKFCKHHSRKLHKR